MLQCQLLALMLQRCQCSCYQCDALSQRHHGCPGVVHKTPPCERVCRSQQKLVMSAHAYMNDCAIHPLPCCSYFHAVVAVEIGPTIQILAPPGHLPLLLPEPAACCCAD
jgi:hypothetical protein